MLIRFFVVVTVLGISTATNQTAATAAEDYELRIAELENSVARLQHWRHHALSDQCTSAGAYAGFSFVFAKLHYHESFQALVQDVIPAPTTTRLVPFDEDYELTPRVWVGMKANNGLGGRISYWNYDHGSALSLTNAVGFVPQANATSVIFPATITTVAPGDVLTVNTGQEATTLDFEGTYDLRVRALEIVVSGGLRYASAKQSYAATTLFVPSALNFIREFEGIGPTFSATGMIPIGNSGLYGTGRAGLSFLFGEKTLLRTVVGDVTPAVVAAAPTINLSDADEITGAYGAAVGVGYQRETRYGNVFIESTYEGQLWTSGGAPTLTFMGFNGLNLSLGLRR